MRYRLAVAVYATVTAFALFAGCDTASYKEADKGEVDHKVREAGKLFDRLTGREKPDDRVLHWYSYEEAAAKAQSEGKYIMVDFYTTWCPRCKEFEQDTCSDPGVVEALNEDFVAVKIDAESAEKVVQGTREMTKKEFYMQATPGEGYPSIVFFDKGGKKVGYFAGRPRTCDVLIKWLDYIQEGKYKTMSYDEYGASL